MPNYKEKNGTTRVGDFLRSIKGVAPEILSVLGTVTGSSSLKALGKQIKSSDSISDKNINIALEMIEMDIKESQEVTKRWNSDMKSDSWLSKNVRPLVLIFLTLSMSTFIIIDSSVNGFEVKDDWISLLSSLLLLVYGAYFGGRSLEKIQKIRN